MSKVICFENIKNILFEQVEEKGKDLNISFKGMAKIKDGPRVK